MTAYTDTLQAMFNRRSPVGSVPVGVVETNGRHPSRSVVRRADQIEPEQVEWLWQGRIPFGKLTVLDGDPGLGKSTLSIAVAAHVTIGAGLDGAGTMEPADVVICSVEDGAADTIVPRLAVAGADRSRCHLYEGVRDGELIRMPTLPDDIAELERLVRDTGAKLVVLDPLMALLGGGTNAHRDQDVRRTLAPLAKMADETGGAVLIVRHLNKASGVSALYRGGGSIGIVGAARAGLLVVQDPDDPDARLLAATKSNLGVLPQTLRFRLRGTDTGVALVEWDGVSSLTADEALAAGLESASGGDRSKHEEAIEWLRGELAGGAQEAKVLIRAARAAGITERTLRRARESLRIKPTRDRFGPGGVWIWRLPPVGEPIAVGDAGDEHAEGGHETA